MRERIRLYMGDMPGLRTQHPSVGVYATRLGVEVEGQLGERSDRPPLTLIKPHEARVFAVILQAAAEECDRLRAAPCLHESTVDTWPSPCFRSVDILGRKCELVCQDCGARLTDEAARDATP